MNNIKKNKTLISVFLSAPFFKQMLTQKHLWMECEWETILYEKRITANLCLGPSLTATYPPIGSGLIWISTILQPTIWLARVVTVACSDMCVFMKSIQ